MLSQLAAEAQPLGEGPVSSKMAEVQQYYDRLKVLVDERDSMLETFMPSVQQYNSSRGAWEDLLCGWEEKAAALPPPGATPTSIQRQIDNIKVGKKNKKKIESTCLDYFNVHVLSFYNRLLVSCNSTAHSSVLLALFKIFVI